MTRVAVVGAGSWGKNLVRTFHDLPQARLLWVVDVDEERLRSVERRFPGVRTTGELSTVLDDGEVEAVVVATPARSHHEVAKAAMLAGKHVHVEKPLALDVASASDLVSTAEATSRILMTGHLLLHHPAVVKLKELLDAGELGEVYYVYGQRVNLGVIRSDENALWSLAPHDLSVMLHLLGDMPSSVSARGASYIRPDVEDVVFVNLRFPRGRMGQIQLSWLDPQKLRRFTVVGSRKMAVFDDMQAREKIRIYDKGVRVPPDYEGFGGAVGLRFGDIFIPRVDSTEPLRLECEHFISCVRTGRRPLTDGKNGLAVVRILEAASRSLVADGAPVTVET